MEEPSLLDYLKSILMPWKYKKLEITPQPAQEEKNGFSEIILKPELITKSTGEEGISGQAKAVIRAQPLRLPWRGMIALIFAMLAQISMAPSTDRKWVPGVILLILSFGWLAWSYLTGELQLAELPESHEQLEPTILRVRYLAIGSILIIFSYLSFQSLQFSAFNLLLLGIVLVLFIMGFQSQHQSLWSWINSQNKRFHGSPWSFSIKNSTLGVLAVTTIVLFFRFYRLGSVPPEMNSDHAEKILDVLRILHGYKDIFFASNGGREALIFYLITAFHNLFGLQLNFMILKLVSSLIGLLALPYLYLLGKELGHQRIGLLAVLLAGIAYWPNVVSRFGLRLPFYMFFTAALLYYLTRGLRHGSRNDMIIAGIFLGLSLYGYTADRILPLLVVIGAGLYFLHKRRSDQRLFALDALLVIAVISFVIFIPLLHYIISQPEAFFIRTFSRMSNWERPIESPVLLIFLSNTWRALAMFSWSGGVIWPISIPNYPALSAVSAALFYSGLGLVLIRYLIKRNWEDALLLISIPVLMLPSILSIAFPDENPNLYRTGGAIVPVFLMAGLALDSLMAAIEKGIRDRWGKVLAFFLAVILLGINAAQDSDLVFRQYNQNYLISSWNSSEMGQVARDFIDFFRAPDSVWVVGYPNWVDTRLVANNAGYPGRDYELKTDKIAETTRVSGAKLFMLNPADAANLDALQRLYPEGHLERYISKVQSKDFLIFYVIPENSG
jgi:hypothetical protein